MPLLRWIAGEAIQERCHKASGERATGRPQTITIRHPITTARSRSANSLLLAASSSIHDPRCYIRPRRTLRGHPPSPLPDAREPLRGVSSDPGKRFPGSICAPIRPDPLPIRATIPPGSARRVRLRGERSGAIRVDARSPIRSDPLHAALYPCSSDVSGSWLLRPPVSDAPGTRSRPIRVPDPGRMHPLPRPPPGARAPGRGSQGGAALSETDPRPPPDAMQNWPQRNEPPPFVVARETVRRRRLRACTPEATAQGVYGLAPWILPPLAHLG